MALFGFTRTGTMLAGATNTNVMDTTAVTSRKLRHNEISLIGTGNTSAAASYMELAIYLATGAAVGAATTLAASKFEADSASFASFVAHTYATSCLAVGGANTAAFVLGCNCYGGIYRWTARPNGEIVQRSIAASNLGAAGSIAYRNNNGSTTGTYAVHTVIDEL